MSELFLEVLNRGISASWVILAVLLLRLLLRRAPKWVAVLLWGIVAVRLICPFSVESAMSLIPSRETIPLTIEQERSPEIDSGIPAIDQVVNPVVSEVFAPKPEASANPLQIYVSLAAVLWMLGMGILLGYSAMSYGRLRRRLRTAIRYRNHIFQSEYISTPFVLGFLKPRIYLPFTLGEQELPYVLAHEEAHISRRDHWWKLLGFLLLSVYWFHPLVWVAYLLLCRDLEFACDERVIQTLKSGEKAEYSQALLSCSTRTRKIAACPLAFGEVGVKERIRSVMKYHKPAGWVIGVSLLLCGVAAVGFLTDPKTEENENRTETAEEAVTSAPKEEPAILQENMTQKDLETLLSETLLAHYKERAEEGVFRTESHEVLANEAMHTADGNIPQKVTFFLLVLRETYGMYQGKLENRAEEYLPVAVTFSIDENGSYQETEYWEPRQGSYYVADVRKKFPEGAAESALNDRQYMISLKEESYQKAQRFFLEQGDLEEHIEELLAEICTGTLSSSPAEAIGNHEQSYKELLDYDTYALRYCFEQFLAGNQTDLRGKVMEELCTEIMGNYGIARQEVLYATGQDWFEAFYQGTEVLAETYSIEEIEKYYPVSFLLLQMLETD